MEAFSMVWSTELEPGIKSKYPPFFPQHVVFFLPPELYNCCINSPAKVRVLCCRVPGRREAANPAELLMVCQRRSPAQPRCAGRCSIAFEHAGSETLSSSFCDKEAAEMCCVRPRPLQPRLLAMDGRQDNRMRSQSAVTGSEE